MDDLKSVTLSYLRDLARKHLGPGHSKLTKKELIAALADFVPALKKLAKMAGIELLAGSKAASKAVAPASKTARGKETRVPEKKEPEKKKAADKTAERRKEPEKKAAERKPEPAPKKGSEPRKGPEPRKSPELKKEPEKKAAERKKPSESRKEPEPKKEPEKKEPEKKAAAPQGRKSAAPRQAALEVEDSSQSLRPAQVVNFPPRPRYTRSAEEEWAESTEVVDSPELESVFQHAAEPLMEGFFVARLMGERELRRHHLTEEQAPRSVAEGTGEEFDEELGELPLDYGNDLALALARDPHTLFISWDFSAATLARGRDGIEEARALLRVFDGDRLVRELEFAPESRSFYIHGLPPGRPYRVEAHYIGRGGRSRRIGHSTHPLSLPRSGPSLDTSVRFMQMPPPPRAPITPGPLETPAPATAAPGPIGQEREYITWKRIALPGSDEMAVVAESKHERLERQARESAQPPVQREYVEVSARPPGSSEQSVRRPDVSGALGGARGGASEQTHWTPPPSGRGR